MVLRFCSCGKCELPCFKHGKIAKCDRCGKKRRLGTQIKGDEVFFICSTCIDDLEEEEQKEFQQHISNALAELRTIC